MNQYRIIFPVAFVLAFVLPQQSRAVKAGGHDYPSRVEIVGKSLKLVGAGLREFLFVDIYSMGMYSESRRCNTREIIKKDEVKYLRLRMSRHIPAKRLASNMKKTLNNNLPPNAEMHLLDKVRKFVSFLKKDCPKDSTLEIIYIPQKGITLKQDGKILGKTIAGKDFQELIFRSYFGTNTCCSGLKESILEYCRN